MNLGELAQRIKSLRLERKLTLEQLATLSGQTRSWISKVENFRVTPSLPALARIASALGVSVAELVDGLDARPRLSVVRSRDRLQIRRDNGETQIRYESLAHSRPNRCMDPFLISIPSGVARREALGHDGEEFLIVLDGPVQLEYDDELHDLNTGDCAYFDATVKHRLINPYETPAQLLCIMHGRAE